MNAHKTETGGYSYSENGFRFVVSQYARRDIYEGRKARLWRYDFEGTPILGSSGFESRAEAAEAARLQIEAISPLSCNSQSGTSVDRR